jgi:hypothetical protein
MISMFNHLFRQKRLPHHLIKGLKVKKIRNRSAIEFMFGACTEVAFEACWICRIKERKTSKSLNIFGSG